MGKWLACYGICLIFLMYPAVADAGILASFEGTIDFLEKKADVNLGFKGQGAAVIHFKFIAQNQYHLAAKIDHLALSHFDLSTEIESKIETVGQNHNGQRFIRGAIESRYTLINYKPVGEMNGSFEIKDQRLYLNSVSWQALHCDGYISLFAPYDLDIKVGLEDIRLTDFSLLLGCPDEDMKLSGFASGRIRLSGFLNRMIISGGLSSYEGIVGDLDYDNFLIRFNGLYPTLQLSDSSATQTDGLSFNLGGYVDLSKGCNLAQGMNTLTKAPVIGESQIQREWTIKRKHEEGRRGTTEFKYRLRLPDDSDVTNKEEGLLGVEHSIEF
ncbi:MAG: hypothetical protein ABIJ41_03010 [Candidatus Omnitrophota bacterium]